MNVKKTQNISTEKTVSIFSSAMTLTAVFGLLLFMSGCGEQILFIIPGIIFFAVLCFMREITGFRIFMMISGVLLIGVLVLFAVKQAQITAGMALAANRLYDIGEKAQAYVYERFCIAVGAEEQEQCLRMAVIWCGCIVGIPAAVPTASVRRWICIGMAAAVMLCFAYFGLLPNKIFIALLLFSLLIAAGSGRIKTILPLLLMATLLFSAVIIIDPGENVAVSKADEQLRDRLAVETARFDGEQNKNSDERVQGKKNDNKSSLTKWIGGVMAKKKGGRLFAVLALILLILLILFVPAVIHDKLEKKRHRNRIGIYDEDPATAVRAMFPYIAKWLKVYGIEFTNMPFSAFTVQVKDRISEQYAFEYDKMLSVWKEAAYSNHRITEEHRSEMFAFMNDTIELTKNKISRTEKARVRFRLAL